MLRLVIVVAAVFNFLLPLAFSQQRGEDGFQAYEVDVEPLKKHPTAAKELERLHIKFQTTPLDVAEHQHRMRLLSGVLEQEPEWFDGYWFYAADAFFLGSNTQDPKDHPQAKIVLQDGLKSVEECLRRNPNHVLCKFFAASVKAKIASIDGILASLRNAKYIRDTWIEVTNSPYNLDFRPNVSLQGSAEFALGLFYRLIPDLFLMRWFWGVQGNIETSIAYHVGSVKRDPKNPCAYLMLAVAQLCQVKGKKDTEQFRSAINHLDLAEKLPAIDLAQAVCISDVAKIRDQPSKTCGYTQAQYQDDISADDLKKK